MVAEGWLEQAQARLLGKRLISRFELLLAFGHDCAGAVSVVDPNPEKISDALIDVTNPKELALLTSRASLSGIQPKLAIIEKQGIFYPVQANQLSTHIAKFPSSHHADLVANEYLTTLAFKTLLPGEDLVEMHIGNIYGFNEDSLIIKRFDRDNGKSLHFEEFNQILNQPSNNKYFGSYETMADFLRSTPGCLPTEVYHLYLRILAGFLLGNTDMHLKNFAMFHTVNGLRLTPAYDQVAAVLYGYNQLALGIGNRENLIINDLNPNDIISLGKEFGLNNQAIMMAFQTLEKNVATAQFAITNAGFGSRGLKRIMVELVDKVWNKTFSSIGQILSQKR